nr:YbjP/YqhG family protein [Roseomonas sp. SXEYE001]
MPLSFLFILLLAPEAGAQTGAQGAQSFLEQLFARYRGGGEVQYYNDAAMRTVFSPDLRAAMRRAHAASKPDEVPCLNGDPIVSAQEIKITGLRIQTEPAGQGRARGTATFRNVGQPRRVQYSLIQTQGGWLIDDIATRDMPSLRAFLAAC